MPCGPIFFLALSAMTAHIRPKLLIFDVNETLLDLSSLQKAVNEEFASEFAFKQWFSLLLQYSLVDTNTRTYNDFSQIGDAALDMLAQSLGQPARSAERKRALLAMLAELPPHPDVVPGLVALQKAGFQLVTLTNSPASTMRKQIAFAGLTSYFEELFSVDAVQLYKPRADTYLYACRQMGVPTKEALLVAAHGWDVAGALRSGLQAAFIARPGQSQYPLAPEPTYVVPTVEALAKQLAG